MELRHGIFNWIDVITTDASVVIPFYEKVFGWSTEEVPTEGPSPYRFFLRDGIPVTGLGEMSDEMKEEGVPSTWNSYIQVG
ncbi:MAG: hypothetical protein RQ745_08830 [Longimicrobiales bacterium]|nr:hypothetical protein [Longimicrobiales bacterium]